MHNPGFLYSCLSFSRPLEKIRPGPGPQCHVRPLGSLWPQLVSCSALDSSYWHGNTQWHLSPDVATNLISSLCVSVGCVFCQKSNVCQEFPTCHCHVRYQKRNTDNFLMVFKNWHDSLTAALQWQWQCDGVLRGRVKCHCSLWEHVMTLNHKR